MTESTVTTVLITGGYGFLGSHVAKRLYDKGGYFVRILDITPSPPHITERICHEFIKGSMCDFATCADALQGVSLVLHFAAKMGGMGVIHGLNDFVIYQQNHTMVQNLLEAALLPGSTVSSIFYASSACVYPEHLQNQNSNDISLCERDIFAGADTRVPRPQGLYGLEKLNSELLLSQSAEKFDIRIARFHNIYGPGGSWNNGAEKAPAALLRKALVCRRLMDKAEQSPAFEIWGDGTQRRSFLFIEDAVDAIIKLNLFSVARSESGSPGHPIILNIGSDYSVSIQDLANLSLRCAGAQANFRYDTSKPVGVASRNSNNELSSATLSWTPRVSLEQGMKQTCDWISGQLDQYLSLQERRGCDLDESLHILETSKLVNLGRERLTFAILLPVTSRGLANENDCLDNLRNFVKTLLETTWRDTHHSSDQSFRYVVYLVIDADDNFLLQGNKAHQVLSESGIPLSQLRQVINTFRSSGQVCAIWRDCARIAYADGSDYFVLMGDDVTLKDEGWMRQSHSTFLSLSKLSGLPLGLGCVAFTDVSFPGMPSFPIIHKTHMDVFQGKIVPDDFVNQDGDPFLFQLYRRWGTSRMFPCRLENTVGGSNGARYIKEHTPGWSLAPLVRADQEIASYLRSCEGFDDLRISRSRNLTLDIIIPCYRVDLTILSDILSLEVPSKTSVNFIIIVDSPRSPFIQALLALYSHDPNVRIRVNANNFGASFSRNRGLAEASAEWVHFLDDDVVPSRDLLFAVSDAINANPSVAGFVCNTQFPVADSIFSTAVHLSGVTYFWDIATKLERDIPWGVTANLVSRRVLLMSDVMTDVKVSPPTRFSLSYPKTGGGEDIDYCLSQRASYLAALSYQDPNTSDEHPDTTGFLPAPRAIVTHPWWNEGKRSYWRFYKWSIGDGHLTDAYPDHSYRDYAPNSAECFLLCGFVLSAAILSLSPSMLLFDLRMISCVFIANTTHDLYRHSLFHPERTRLLNVTPRIRKSYFLWTAAMLESSLIRMFSELGKLRSIVERREWYSIGKRFDWFVGRIPGDMPKKEERKNSMERVGLSVVFYAITVALTG